MSDRDEDVRATAEQLVADAAQLQAIEVAKVGLPDGDPRLVSLSEEAARLTDVMAQTARIQLEVAEDSES